METECGWRGYQRLRPKDSPVNSTMPGDSILGNNLGKIHIKCNKIRQ